MNDKSPAALKSLVAVCFAGLLLSFSVWLVNLEMAMRVYLPDWRLFSLWFPDAWLALSADLSTISTLVPVLLLAFPLVQGWRLLKAAPHDPHFGARLEADPYPPHFSFFLVMLGLVGTLYGLMIGLDLSGVSELAGQPLSQDAIRHSLDRLLGGTATALLSSLVGILGAFAAARPLAWIFRRAADLTPDVQRQGITAAVSRLTRDLEALGETCRAFAALPGAGIVQTVTERLEAQQVATEAVARQLGQTHTLLERMAIALEGHADMTREMAALRTEVQQVVAATSASRESLTLLEETARTGQAHLAALETMAAEGGREFALARGEADTRHREAMAAVQTLQTTASASREGLEQDRASRRKALAAYVNDTHDAAKELG